jgi:hypothetical protein
VREFFAPYGEYAGLAGWYALQTTRLLTGHRPVLA